MSSVFRKINDQDRQVNSKVSELRPVQSTRKNSRGESVRRLVRIGEGACYLGISVSKLRALAWAGEIAYVQEKRNALMLFEIAELDRWVERHKVAC